MSLKRRDILLVIPVYNHGVTLRRVVEQGLAAGWPVLVVDDGSTDRGAETLRDLACQVHMLSPNQGKGAALLAGARVAMESGYKAIITVDADGQLDPAEAGHLAETAAGDWPCMVIGARRMDPAATPTASRFGRAFSNFWVWVECRRRLPDTQSGFRLYPVELFARLPLVARRYDFEVEVITRAAWAGLSIRSCPVSVHYPPGSERISHFDQFRDNLRLTRLHTRLVIRGLLPRLSTKLYRTGVSEGLSLVKRAEALGHAIFYLTLRLFGQKGAYALLYLVIGTYVAASRAIRRNTAHYLEKRFPDEGGARWILHTFRLVLAFGRILVDRAWLGIDPRAELEIVFPDYLRLQSLAQEGKGVVLLTAHVGNWQTALTGLNRLAVPVNVLMRYDHNAVAKHYFELAGKGGATFRIINADGFTGGMVEAAAALGRGEVVTIMADRLTKGPWASVNLLGAPVRLPTASYQLAASTGAAVAVLLAAKTGARRCSLEVADIFFPQYSDRLSRVEVLTTCAARFSAALEKYLRIFPYQWFNFFNIWKQ